jgi:hypothetical protein
MGKIMDSFQEDEVGGRLERIERELYLIKKRQTSLSLIGFSILALIISLSSGFLAMILNITLPHDIMASNVAAGATAVFVLFLIFFMILSWAIYRSWIPEVPEHTQVIERKIEKEV